MQPSCITEHKPSTAPAPTPAGSCTSPPRTRITFSVPIILGFRLFSAGASVCLSFSLSFVIVFVFVVSYFFPYRCLQYFLSFPFSAVLITLIIRLVVSSKYVSVLFSVAVYVLSMHMQLFFLFIKIAFSISINYVLCSYMFCCLLCPVAYSCPSPFVARSINASMPSIYSVSLIHSHGLRILFLYNPRRKYESLFFSSSCSEYASYFLFLHF